MPDCTAISERTGHCVMFIGNEAQHWTISQLVEAAKRAKDLGCDAICVKRADGTNRWCSDLKGEYEAVMALGMTYIPMIYCYGPAFGESQIVEECAILAEMQGVCGGLACANMEKEWNGQVAHAASFARHMQALKAPNSLLIVSTWADPQQQEWANVVKALLPVVDCWWPEQYTNWLAGQERQLLDLGESCIAPTIDLSYPRNIDDYMAIAKGAKARGHTTLSIWEYGDTKGKETDIKSIAVLMHAQTTEAPTVIVEPSTPTKGDRAVTSHAEVIDCVTISQFESGESAYECVCYAVATCHYGGKSGQGPTGSPEQVDQLADQWYAKLTGSLTNSNGLSVNQELQMIAGVGNHYQVLPVEAGSPHDRDIANVKGALLRGYPVIICGAETGMVDVELGGRIPYGWTPSGNHCIVATGIAADGNLLVRDPANVVGNTPRHQPRTYDIGSLDLVSGVVFVPPWMAQPSDTTDWTSAPSATHKEEIAVNITDPSIATYFEVVGGSSLKRKDTGVSMGSGLTAYYLKYGGVATFRLPVSGEIPVTDANNQPIPRLVYVIMESGILVYDPEQKNPDHPPTKEPCYLMRIDSGPGQRLIAKSLLQVESIPSAKQEIIKQIKTLAASL